MAEADWSRPERLQDAIAALGARPLTVLAGGTDYYAARVGKPLRDAILDITGIAELRGIRRSDDGWRIGATTTWSDLVRAEHVPPLRGLQLAAREVGGVQVQNTGTIAGNLCNASPAADGVPALLALDASVELVSGRGSRMLELGRFITGNRRTAREPDELLAAIRVPPRSSRTGASFLKLGHRRYLVISIAMVSVVIDCDERGRIDYAGVAVGACGPVAQRLPALEARLLGQPLHRQLAELVQADDLSVLAPIDDLRGTREYRLDAALTLVRRALRDAAAQAMPSETGGAR